MRITYAKPAHLFIWMFAFSVLGPLLGLVQVILLLIIYNLSLSPLMLFPFGFVYTWLFLLPALVTGVLMYFAKDLINRVWQLLVFCLSGMVLTYAWMMLISQFNPNYNEYHWLFSIISYTSTLILSAWFINHSNVEIQLVE